MNKKQKGRLNKAITTIGVIVCGAVVWFFSTKWIISLLHIDPEMVNSPEMVVLFIFIGIIWPTVVYWIGRGCFNLYTWIKTGEVGNLIDEESEKGPYISEDAWKKCRKKSIEVEYWIADNVIHIETLEGIMIALKGDYIIRGVNKEIYPCKPDIFKKTYDIIEG